MENILWKKDYWSEESIHQVLRHTWSLGVEMQFYLLAPLLALVIRRASGSRAHQRLFGCVVIIGSFVLHHTSTPSVSFGLVLCRLWQFGLGGAVVALPDVSFLRREEKKAADPGEGHGKSINLKGGTHRLRRWIRLPNDVRGEVLEASGTFGDETSQWAPITAEDAFIGMLVNCAISFSSLLLMMTPEFMSRAICRLLVTLSTAAVIALGTSYENPLFSNKILVHLGDLSYVLYLVHWPAIVLWKYYWDVVELDDHDIAIILVAIYIVSLLVYLSLERFFIEHGILPAAITVAAIYALMLAALFSRLPMRYAEYASPTSNAIQWNRDAILNDAHITTKGYAVDEEVEAMIDYTPERETHTGIIYGNDTASVLLIGNSFGLRGQRSYRLALRFFNRKRLKKRFTDAMKYSGCYLNTKSKKLALLEKQEMRALIVNMLSGCGLLIVDNCPGYKRVVKRLLAKWRPDIIFVVAWENPEFLLSPVSDPPSSDPVLPRMQHNLDWISNATSVVVLDSAPLMLPLHESLPRIMVRALSKGRDIGGLKDSWEEYLTDYRHQRARFDALHAPNLVKNRVMEQLCAEDNGVCYFYNRNNSRAYYQDSVPHYTSEGLKLLAPGYQTIVDNFLDNFHT